VVVVGYKISDCGSINGSEVCCCVEESKGLRDGEGFSYPHDE